MTDSIKPSTQKCDRILIVGPVLPYRGGIAQHTTMLHRSLRSKTDCLTISFLRQYPKWLFPGKSDKDEKLADHHEDGVEYIIDSVNPLSWARAVKRVMEFRPKQVLFPWWHVYWAPCFAWMCNRLNNGGVKIVFLCHNTVEHENAVWKRILGDFVLSYADRFIVHTSADKANLLERFPSISVDVHPIPIFEQFPKSTVELPRRAKLELLFFGFVRPYKGLGVLLEAMALLKNEDIYLSVVGEFWRGETDTRKYIVDAGLASKVELVARYVSDIEAAAYFERCDIVVLPYLSATGSGVIPLAYHYCKPVIATRVGGLPDVVDDGVTGVLVDPGACLQLAEAIKKVISGEVSFDAEGIQSIKTRLTWSGLAKSVLGSSSNRG